MSRKILYQSLALVVAIQNPPPRGGAVALNPEVFARPFPVADQQFFAGVPQVVTSPSNSQNAGWHPQPPDVFAKPFPVTEQQFTAPFIPRGNVPVAGTGQWFPQPPDVFAKPFPIADQQFLTLGPEQVPQPVNAEGFYPQPPDVFAKPFPVVEQQFLIWDPQQVIPVTAPEGWRGIQALEYRFAKPFPVEQQQHVAEMLLPIITNTKVAGWHPQAPDVFARLFPVTAMQFDAWPVQLVPPYNPPGSGRRKDFPSYIPQPPYEAEPSKPFRPIWDLRAEAERKALEPQPGFLPPEPQGPVPLPPASLFAGMPQQGPASLLAPTMPAGLPQGLPTFDHLVPQGMTHVGDELRDAQDRSDAMAMLQQLLGLLH